MPSGTCTYRLRSSYVALVKNTLVPVVEEPQFNEATKIVDGHTGGAFPTATSDRLLALSQSKPSKEVWICHSDPWSLFFGGRVDAKTYCT